MIEVFVQSVIQVESFRASLEVELIVAILIIPSFEYSCAVFDYPV